MLFEMSYSSLNFCWRYPTRVFNIAVVNMYAEDNISHNQVIVEIYVASITQHQIFYIVVNKRQQVLSCYFL